MSSKLILCVSNDIIKVKRQPAEWNKFKNHVSAKDFTTRLYKEHLQFNNKINN